MFTDALVRGNRLGHALIGLPAILVFLLTGLSADVSANRQETAAAEANSVVDTVPDLVLDLTLGRMTVRLAGVVVREYALTILDDADEIREIVGDGSDSSSREQIVQSMRLLSASKTISDAELGVIAEETGLRADQIQRYIPRKMTLVTSAGLRIYVESDCENAVPFRWEQVKDVFAGIWHSLTGGDSLHLVLTSEDAMSLCGIARNRPRLFIR